MPELPDVETMRRFLAAEALRRPIADVEVRDVRPLASLPPGALSDALLGRELVDTLRHGKWLFAESSDGPWLALHFRMTGSLVVTAPGEPPPRFARLTFRFVDGGALHFVDQRRFGVVTLTGDPVVFADARGLGPDALDPALTAAAFRARLERRSGRLKPLLLDQGFVAGVGNIYGDEICHTAGLAPLSRVEHLGGKERDGVYRAMRGVLTTAVARMAEGRAFPRGWLIGRRHDGGVCPRCGAPVSKVRLQGRYTYWCPCSQRLV